MEFYNKMLGGIFGLKKHAVTEQKKLYNEVHNL
jgi:hypothetical protein